jgi:hypothetical protein
MSKSKSHPCKHPEKALRHEGAFVVCKKCSKIVSDAIEEYKKKREAEGMSTSGL